MIYTLVQEITRQYRRIAERFPRPKTGICAECGKQTYIYANGSEYCPTCNTY